MLKPILLVDEIETHLHYDAQVDLINVLASQHFTSKVIYTTHSFGCLPPDLGTGVRLVRPVTPTTSKLVNGFWREGVGFSPLLASMGAAAVSFTPSRHAVIAEGPSDAILLPTLLRQASVGGETEGQPVRFQIVPGVAEVAAAKCHGLQSEAGHVVFLVDGDQGGLDNKKKLVAGGIDPALIVVLTEAGEGSMALETEDLIDAEIYASAVNDEILCWTNSSSPRIVTTSELGSALRTKALENWCEANETMVPDKIAVAERVIEKSTENEIELPIFDTARRDIIRQLRIDLAARLGVGI